MSSSLLFISRFNANMEQLSHAGYTHVQGLSMHDIDNNVLLTNNPLYLYHFLLIC